MIVREDGIKFYEDKDEVYELEALHVFQDNIKIIVDKLDKIQDVLSKLRWE